MFSIAVNAVRWHCLAFNCNR